jgi:hypothetical protein
MQCFSWILLLALAVFLMVSLLRWFEQTSEAVERREWNRVTLLVLVPFAVWFYPSKVAAGRPTSVPRHEPVRGFGALPKDKRGAGDAGAAGSATPASGGSALKGLTDEPPPGTPKEFLGMPVVPPKAKAAKPPVDPEKLAKLRRKMIEQGMLKDEDDGNTAPPPG